MVAGAGVWAFRYATEAARPSDAGSPVMVSVFEGQTDAEVADELESQGLIKSKMLFQGQLRLSGGALVPGTYTLRKGMSVPQIVDSITGAAPAEEVAQEASTAPESFDITIPEGWRTEQVAEEYERLGGEGGAEAFMQAVKDIDRSQFDFLADLSGDDTLEGYLFPDTYRFSGTNPTANVATMLTNFDNKYTPEMRQRTTEMGLNLEQVLTVASLVEREAQLEKQTTLDDAAREPRVARVSADRTEEDRVVSGERVEVVLLENASGFEVVAGPERVVGGAHIHARGFEHLEGFRDHLRSDSVSGDDCKVHGVGHAFRVPVFGTRRSLFWKRFSWLLVPFPPDVKPWIANTPRA